MIKLNEFETAIIRMKRLGITQAWLAKQLSTPKNPISKVRVHLAFQGRDAKLFHRIQKKINKLEK